MGKEGKRLKRCSASASTSTSTDVEAANPKPLQKAERELETDVKPKKFKKSKQNDLEPRRTSDEKNKKKKEMKKLRKSFKEMTETMKNLQNFLMLKGDLPGMSLKEISRMTKPSEEEEEEEEEAPERTMEDLAAPYECCFETEDADGNNWNSIFVSELDTSLARDYIKASLREHFESRGCQVTRVFVPIECETGVPLGFAFIDVDDVQKALQASCLFVRRRLILISLAENRPECTQFPNFTGCEHCGTILLNRRLKRFYSRHAA